ncbi:phosphoenolpyruvate--protein phosphotransferase [Lentzea sp. BCCO 10_0856]|uniref:Phosphoenolpyruvate-protein phosphotransferase n=1 Tax=Lentzea miocenica TaxID=3095431 RepID=A0ABU4SV46_9PSEU|nr:phosphoenolpyruvate--protein phosphotransferase [Lentzea sp. BCCO 10_0856]MDX8029751.1 phosphoenolpyruvate--protein phosphotransferase [Lentzea sp. BCCO 10_0856]
MSSARLSGVGVSSGRATGPVVRVSEALPEPPAGPRTADTKMEASLIRPATEVVAQRLMERAKTVEGEARAVLETTAAMAGDPALIKAAEKLVVDESLTAARAVHQAAQKFISALQAAGGYMAERARDVQDVRDRVVAELLGLPAPGVPDLTSPSVLVARDLAPADTAGLDPSKVLALVTEEGGPTSHTAILARSLGIPAVVACRGILAFAGTALDVDGDTGQVRESDGKVRAAGTGKKATWNGVGVLKDGLRVKVLGNVGSPADAAAAAAAGAEGVGLFRTEFCFLDAAEEPTVAEQTAAYEAVLAPFAGKPVVVRTLDAGADKPLAFLNPDPEPNPALGVRGLRVAFDRPEILDRQLEAIAAAAVSSGADVSVMAPMVATAAEAAWFVERARKAGIKRVGVMVEVPSAALSAKEILQVVDFISIGTNDLAQYVFAADRQLGGVAALNDPWQPALLRLIALVGEAATATGKPVGVCGEAAADPLLACVLIGMGVTSLSMNHTALADVGARLATSSMDICQLAARGALAAGDPATAKLAARAPH